MMGFDRHFNEIYYKYEPMGMILRDIVEISCGYRRGSFVASNITINIYIYIYTWTCPDIGDTPKWLFLMQGGPFKIA